MSARNNSSRSTFWPGVILVLTALLVVFFIVSLHTGWLNALEFGTDKAHVQGIDFFPVERAWLNLLDGRSQYDTFASSYGPYATWYVYHPAMALVIGPLLMTFPAWKAYAVWVVLSVLLLALAAFTVSRLGGDPLRRALVFLLLTVSVPAYLTLQAGNVQALIVVSFALVFVAVEVIRRNGVSSRAEWMLFAGLLISLFSKPFVLAMLPLLLLLPETRRTALRVCAIYAVVSLLLIVVPGLNPQSIPWSLRWTLFTHPEIMQQSMNPLTNGFHILPPMRDNAIHWLAMVGLSNFRYNHIEVYSLPVYLDGVFSTHTPDGLYSIPGILVLEATVLIALVRDARIRLEAAILTLMAASLLVFLSYGLAWEYHFTIPLVIAAVLLMRSRLSQVEWLIIALCSLEWLPSLYIFERNSEVTISSMNWMHGVRILPVVAVFFLLLGRAAWLAVTAPSGLRWITQPRTVGSPTPQVPLSLTPKT